VAAVRAANPQAFLLYKEHPDVLAGNRRGKLTPEAAALIDARCDQHSIPAVLERVQEVHTLTSLTGFEALLRGKPVTTYGQPFYASWGLTTDHAPVAHRTRRLNLAQLTAGALLLYPRYIDPVTGLPCEAEFLVERLASLIRDGGPVRTDGLYALTRYARAIRYGLFPPKHARTY
jgi:capsular polysaccharide export protein